MSDGVGPGRTQLSRPRSSLAELFLLPRWTSPWKRPSKDVGEHAFDVVTWGENGRAERKNNRRMKDGISQEPSEHA
jgi:hypothetical protein